VEELILDSLGNALASGDATAEALQWKDKQGKPVAQGGHAASGSASNSTRRKSLRVEGRLEHTERWLHRGAGGAQSHSLELVGYSWSRILLVLGKGWIDGGAGVLEPEGTAGTCSKGR